VTPIDRRLRIIRAATQIATAAMQVHGAWHDSHPGAPCARVHCPIARQEAA
jgi:hypothetical protein